MSRRSETFRRGEPPSHEKAVAFVVDFTMENWKRIFLTRPSFYAPYNYMFSDKFVKENKLQYYIHEYDFGALVGDDPQLVVEIGAVGDDSRHQLPHKSQLINDGIAEKNIRENHPYSRFLRINKEDAMDRDHLEHLLCRY